jgi:heat shock protein HslJ
MCRPALAVCLCLFVTLVQAVAPPAALAETGDISVGGVWVCRLTRGVAGLTLAQRVAQIEQRVADVLSIPVSARPRLRVEVRSVRPGAAIVAGDITVMTVTPEDAAGTGVSAYELATQWARRLAEGLRRAFPGREVTARGTPEPAPADGLEGPGRLVGVVWSWQYTQSSDGSGVMPGDPRRYTILFLENGTVEVRADCLTATGAYVVRGQAVSISVAQPAAHPPCAVGPLERRLFAALNGVARYSLDGGTLVLLLKGNVGTMRFRAL